MVHCAFKDCEVIIHAGDITDPSVCTAFTTQRLLAVHGNMCNRSARNRFPEARREIIDGYTIAVCHGAGNRLNIEERLFERFHDVDCIVYGHTHQPVINQFGGILFVNPGKFLLHGTIWQPCIIRDYGNISCRVTSTIERSGAARMKTLWTPWRMEHIEGTRQLYNGCLFKPPGLSGHSKKHLLLFRDDHVVCLLNRYPYTNGHLLAAPARHVACITELTRDETNQVMDFVKSATAILKHHLNPDGFNIGLNLGSEAGAGIADHLHFHIVPRWNGDHNFMTVISEVRTIPEHIEATFDKLLPDFKALRKQ